MAPTRPSTRRVTSHPERPDRSTPSPMRSSKPVLIWCLSLTIFRPPVSSLPLLIPDGSGLKPGVTSVVEDLRSCFLRRHYPDQVRGMSSQPGPKPQHSRASQVLRVPGYPMPRGVKPIVWTTAQPTIPQVLCLSPAPGPRFCCSAPWVGRRRHRKAPLCTVGDGRRPGREAERDPSRAVVIAHRSVSGPQTRSSSRTTGSSKPISPTPTAGSPRRARPTNSIRPPRPHMRSSPAWRSRNADGGRIRRRLIKAGSGIRPGECI